MKKIIFACLVVPTMFISLAAFADTAEQIIIDAAKATIEQARKDGSAVVFTSNNAVKTMYTAGYQSPQMESYQSEVYLNLASLRYQAEVYHSMKNNYGAATNSCSQGIFAESGKNGGLKSIISNIFKQTKTVSCVAAASSKTNLGDAWMVIAKSDNKFMCVDSSGSVMLVGGMARKGITRCKDAPKTPATVMNSSVKTTFMLQPKTDGTFDSSYDIKMNKMGNISTYTEMTIKDITYKLIDNHFLKMLTSEAGAPISATVTAAIRGRYVSIPQNLSAIAYAYGKSSTELQKTVDVALNPKRFTAVYNRTTTTGEQMYTVSLPVSVLMRIARGSIGSGVESSPTSSLEDAIMKLDVKIKDGLITSITAPKQVLKWNTVTGTFTGSVKTVQGSVLSAPDSLKTISCRDLLTQFNVGEEQKAYVCDVRSVQEDLAVLKQKAEDVVGQSVLSNMRVQAELYYSNMNSYGPTVSSCSAGIFAEKNAVGGLGDAMSNLGTVATELSCVAGGTMNQQGSQSWRVSARLQSSKYWCSDSTGNMTEVSATIPTYQLTCK